MGIYDREYVRVGPRSPSGLGSLRFISFNSWLIIANVAVFVLNLLSAAAPVPVTVDVRQSSNFDPKTAYTDGVLRNQFGQPLPLRVPVAVRGPQGQPVPDPAGRTIPNPALRSGMSAVVVTVDRPSGEVVRTQTVRMMPALEAWGHFSTALGFLGLQLWRFLTFQFLHANFLHLFFNMFGLFIFGGMVEQYLGFRRYAAFYLICGIFGAIAYLILNLLNSVGIHIPGFSGPFTPLIGASAGVFGVIIACAYIAPNAIIQLIFPPIPLTLKWFAYGYVAIAAINLLRGGANAGGDAAHMGGAIAGYFFIRNAHLLRDFFDVFGDSRRKPRRPRDAGSSADVDRILAKLHAQGLASLTDAEKRALMRATERQRQR